MRRRRNPITEEERRLLRAMDDADDEMLWYARRPERIEAARRAVDDLHNAYNAAEHYPGTDAMTLKVARRKLDEYRAELGRRKNRGKRRKNTGVEVEYEAVTVRGQRHWSARVVDTAIPYIGGWTLPTPTKAEARKWAMKRYRAYAAKRRSNPRLHARELSSWERIPFHRVPFPDERVGPMKRWARKLTRGLALVEVAEVSLEPDGWARWHVTDRKGRTSKVHRVGSLPEAFQAADAALAKAGYVFSPARPR